MREHLVRIDVCFFAQGFHIPPDVCPTNRLSAARDEDTARFDPLLRRIAEQFLLQFAHDKHRTRFALAGNRSFAALCGFHGDELQFAHADTRATDRLQDQAKTLVVLRFRRIDKPHILRFCQFLFLRAENLLLHLD